ncbi:GNAT family N-acetyltransferase [Lactococcus nasutitermitis]|uniref:GNAT family N-acetyltransferase n=1 Tax=Lactococcus nasutitermitis TaxID=1652957 RepID=A0ABV9JGG0_9LACT|nr:GNAT family N-acetyltransferase [Lactococcus nasutitermitis]
MTEARHFWQLQKQLDVETDFMMYEPDERVYDLGRTEELIESADFLMVAEENGKLLGYISGERGEFRRNQHSVYLVLGLLTQARGKGLGTALLEQLESWARSENMRRLELTVEVTNQPALALYQKMNFLIEGTRRDSMCVAGQFVDEYLMSKILF